MKNSYIREKPQPSITMREKSTIKISYNHFNIFFTSKTLITTNLSIDLLFLSQYKRSTFKEFIVVLCKQINITFLYIMIISYRRSIYFLI